jgi:ketosteroid isomerase-like protein
MKRRDLILIAGACSLLLSGTGLLPADKAMAQQTAQRAADVAAINAAGQAFIAAIGARDIGAMEKLWAHEPYAAFIGPLSTTVVVGWDGVRKAWEMRFGQFDRVTISVAESHARINGHVAWMVGIEKVELLGKDGRKLSFAAFVTNVFEKQNGRWLVISHHATPMFTPAQ